MQGIGGFLCSFCVDGAIWEAMGRRPAGNVGRDAGGNAGRDQGGKERRRWRGNGCRLPGPVLGRWSRAWGCGLRPGGLVGQATSRWGIYGGRGSGKRAGRFGGRQYRLSTPILHPSENITDLAGTGPWFGGIRRRTQGGAKSDGRQGTAGREDEPGKGQAGRWARRKDAAPGRTAGTW